MVVILLQRSEGGALGIGGGGGMMTARGQANFLTRATAVLAGLFIVTSLTLAILASHGRKSTSVLDTVPSQGRPPSRARRPRSRSRSRRSPRSRPSPPRRSGASALARARSRTDGNTGGDGCAALFL